MSHVACRMSLRRVSRAGQSLIEAIVAISVLTTGFLGISTLLARSYFLSRVVSDQITANYLAAEGIEISKNLIDHDVYESLAGNPSFFWGRCFSYQGNPEQVEVDYATTDCSAMAAFSGSGHLLSFDPVTHLYGYNLPLGDNPTPTNFTREILVSANGQQITVDSIVRWNTGSVTLESLRLEDTFYDWQQ